jgi:hypothetical protein
MTTNAYHLKQVRETTERELTADQLERVSGGLKITTNKVTVTTISWGGHSNVFSGGAAEKIG